METGNTQDVLYRDLPLEELRRLAAGDPAAWADLYDQEMVRRSDVYRTWLRDTGLLDTAQHLHSFRSGHVDYRRSWWRRLRLWLSP